MLTNKKNKDDNGLKMLFIDELKDIYWAEKAMVKTMPKISKKATNGSLIKALERHLSETINQVSRLENIFQVLSMKPQAKKCPAMAGLIDEAERIIAETQQGPIRDVGIISAFKKIEHYEIASYGVLRTFADKLKLTRVVEFLEETLNEEENADEALASLTELCLNEEVLSSVSIEDDGEMGHKYGSSHL